MHPLEKRVSELWTVVGREGLYSWMGGVCLGLCGDLKGCSRSLEDGLGGTKGGACCLMGDWAGLVSVVPREPLALVVLSTVCTWVAVAVAAAKDCSHLSHQGR